MCKARYNAKAQRLLTAATRRGEVIRLKITVPWLKFAEPFPTAEPVPLKVAKKPSAKVRLVS